jgi:hypothetical protein
MKARGIVVAVAALVCGCRVGPGSYRYATDPHGASITIEMASGHLGGELLEATDEGVLLVTGGRELHFVHYRAVHHGEVAQFPDLEWQADRSPDAKHVGELRRISRFPQGTTPAIRRALLEAYGQAELRTWQN